MMDWLPIIRGVVTRPLQTFEEVADRYTWRVALPYNMLIAAVSWLVSLVRPRPIDARGRALPEFIGSPFFSFLLTLAIPLLALLFVMPLYWVARQQGGQGSWTRLYTTELVNNGTINLLSLPLVLPLNALFRWTGRGSLLSEAVGLGFAIWGMVLTYFSVRASMRLTHRAAINTIVIAIGIGIAIFVVFGCGLVIFAVSRRP